MWLLAQIALGGALGAVCRYLCVQGFGRLMGLEFPWGTGIVNVVGSFLMGLAFVWLGPRASPLVMVGFLGGFTTFSAYSLEIVGLFERGNIWGAVVYAGGSVILCVLAVAAGLSLGRGVLS